MADVSIDATVSTSTARGMRSVVFTTALNGYWFYIDSGGQFGYSRTTDGGATWGAFVQISGATTHVAFDVWYDQWTPGDTTGIYIHIWYFDTTNDLVLYGAFNTSTNFFGDVSATVFTGASAVAGRGAFVSGTKTRSGYLYCAYDIDAGAERGIHRSTNGGSVWSASLSTTFVEATIDQCQLFPATGTGDNNDCWSIYQDASADALTMKMWDSSAAAEVESSTIQTMVENTTDLTGQVGFSGAIRVSDGALILVSCSERDTATADMQCWEVTAVNAGSLTGITAKTNITTNIDDIYYPSVFINANNGDIYVAYNGKRDGSEVLGTTTKIYYVKSTDGGTTWSSGDTAYQEGATSANFQTWCPLTGKRFYVGWRVGTTLVGNAVNALSMANAYTLACVQGAFALNGQTITLTRNRIITLVQGAYVLTGQTVGLSWNRYAIIVPTGNFALNGQTVSLLGNRLIALAQGAFSLTGNVVNLLRGRLIAIQQGGYALSGQTVGIAKGFRIVVVQGAFTLTGQALSFFRGRIMALVQGAFSLSGQAVTLTRSRIMALAQGAYTLTGQTVSLLKGLRLTATQGGYTLTGNAVVLARGKFISIVQGAYALSGQVVNLLFGRKIAFTQGGFSLNGQAVTLQRSRSMPVTQGAYALTGFDTALLIGHKITIVQGSFLLNGQAVTLTYTPVAGDITMTIETGNFALNGQAETLLFGRKLSATQGAYALNGQPLAFSRTRRMTFSQGGFALNGQPVGFLRGRIITAGFGQYIFTGQPVGLAFGRRLTAENGLYVLTGEDIEMRLARVLLAATGFYILTGRPTGLHWSRIIVADLALAVFDPTVADSFFASASSESDPQSFLSRSDPARVISKSTLRTSRATDNMIGSLATNDPHEQ